MLWACAGWLAWSSAGAAAKDLYVAPDGQPSGPGTLSKPFDLETSLSGEVGRPGDTFWLRGGTYALGHVDTQIQGKEGKPITFRSWPGEWPVIDGSLTIWNSQGHLIFRDFELFNSNPRRVSSQIGVGFKPTDIEIVAGIQSYAPNCQFINLVIHDQTRHGIFLSRLSDNNLIYGCVIYNNGWRSPDNAEGHSLYVQGSSGWREVSDNILFNSAGAGMHVYDNGGPALVGVVMDGNVAFHAGAIQDVRPYRDWVIGVDAPSPLADRIVFKNNMGYCPDSSMAYRQVQLGREGVNGDLTVTNNYMPMGLLMNNWTTVKVQGNTFMPFNSDYAVELRQERVALSGTWDDNSYSCSAKEKDFCFNDRVCSFREWRRRTGHDASATEPVERLEGVEVRVRPNAYEAGRANIVVYNWDKQPAVSVDVGSVITAGMAYEVRNAQDFHAPPVLAGIHDGRPLRLPMRGLRVAPPLGKMLTPPPTGPVFNVFILLPLSSLPAHDNAAP